MLLFLSSLHTNTSITVPTCPEHTVLCKATLLQRGESGINLVHPTPPSDSSLPPSLVSFLLPSDSSAVHLQWGSLVPSLISCDSLSDLRVMQIPFFQESKQEKDLAPS